MFQVIAFYPSLAYNLLRNAMQPEVWKWYNRVEGTPLLLGAIPFKSMTAQLIEKEGVGGVVCCTEDFELKALGSILREEDWTKSGVRFHHLPMKDFFGSAERKEIHEAVLFIEEVEKEGKNVYIHCKAGRTRSATVATCYLMKRNNWNMNTAFEFIKQHRPQARLQNPQWRSCGEYRRFLDHLRV